MLSPKKWEKNHSNMWNKIFRQDFFFWKITLNNLFSFDWSQKRFQFLLIKKWLTVFILSIAVYWLFNVLNYIDWIIFTDLIDLLKMINFLMTISKSNYPFNILFIVNYWKFQNVWKINLKEFKHVFMICLR